ncbi:outer membrane beta-barrel family protein [Chryseobacterium sp.]|uniref:outer membrane beta-barrel family protein n=1 Tax=Chryseobacterium sp. TaxID=1871047 RepID=UPI000EC2DD15|nr:outer membrane beta-barrel family protein [Chryseobacterium sp.]HCM34184.1 TonB-dependent receptor [Chryseobacterium sp.]
MRKSNLIGAALFLSISTVSAQNIINGKVKDIQGQSVPFASVKIFASENKTDIISEKITDENGLFSVSVPKGGNYYVSTSASGYSDITQNYMFDPSQNNLTISISKEKIAGIKEVVLVGTKKKIFERKIDRFVFNTENSIASKGVDGLDVLAATPLVKADDEGNIGIVGKSGVSIMINDRPVNLSGKDLVSYLKTIRSENIERIEVITTPPAKYEAAGNSGIINIVLKQNPKKGFSGNISTSYTRKSKDGFSNNGALNYQSNKVNTSLRVSQFDAEKIATENLTIFDVSQVENNVRRLDRNRGYNINYNIDYSINSKTSVGAIYNYSNTKINSDSDIFSKYSRGNVIDSLISTKTFNESKVDNHQLNVYFEKKLDSLGKKLYVGGNLFDSRNKNPFLLRSEVDNNSNIDYDINSRYKYQIYSGQVDFYLPFKKFVGEIGGKYTRFNTDTELGFFNYENGTSIYDNIRSNAFTYKEDNWASYITLSKAFSEKWEGKAGIRYEFTSLDGISRNGENVNNNYGKWFPSLYLTYKPSTKNIFTLSYSKRISRPSARALNPTTIYLDPYSYATGNPYLVPSFSNNIELGYVFNNKLSVTAFYQKSTNNFDQVVSLNNGYRTINYLNSYDEQNVGVNATYYNTFFKRWDLYTTANYSYIESKGLIKQVKGLSSNSLYYAVNNTVHLNKAKTVSFLVNFSHYLPYTKGNFKFENMYNLASGLRISLFEKKLQVNMTVQDILKGMRFKGNSYYSTYYTHSDNYYDARSFNLSVTYQFGNNKVKGNNKKANLEDVNRAN